MFAMTSFGAKIDESINVGRGPYAFKVSGQIYHWIGSLCPPAGESPRFLQLYIYDTDNEVQNMMHHFGGIDISQLEPRIVEVLIYFLDAHNELMQLFRTARDKCRELDIIEFKIRLYNAEGAKGYELPTSNTLGAMVFENGISDNAEFDVIIQHKDGPPQRVNKLHPSYMSLQFPLLFIYGQPGYHTELTLKSTNGVGRGKRVTMLAYYRYQLYFRLQQYDLLFRGGRLFQQYVVGVFCAVEHNRIDYIRKNKMIFEVTTYWGCGPRYMYAHYLDALTICWKLGNPQFFITFTCNVNWPEIKRFMSEYPHLTASDRADVVCRVFEQKIQALIAFLKEERIFGDVTGVLYTVEFQKRGLPRCDTLLWVDSASRIRIAEDVDRFISAELPDPRIDPEGYNVVSELMMHGTCGDVSLKAPCMKGDKCSKKFPKKINQKTFFNENGHLDNSYVVPYNRDLLLAFRAHINVEYCGWSMLIKYLFKYISKGTDRVFARVSRPIGESSTATTPSRQVIDEIQNYVEGHFICAHEAYCRILKFDIHRREPDVQILAVHLEDMQRITFRDQDRSLYLFMAMVELAKHFSGKPSLVSYVLKERLYWQSHPQDEAPMNDRRYFEELDRSLRDIVDKPSSLLGGKSVLLGGDFRQTLPVKKGASKIKVISSCMSEFALWPSFKVFMLKHNIRLARPDISLEERSLVNSFASWLLDVGDGKICEPADEDPENTSWFHIPPAYCFTPNKEGLSKLIDFIYDQSTLHTPSATTLQQKAIVCPKNETADIINSKVLAMVPGESTIYMRQDEATPTENDGAVLIPSLDRFFTL
ncbi:DNA helicase [Tanacetum coccineum]